MAQLHRHLGLGVATGPAAVAAAGSIGVGVDAGRGGAGRSGVGGGLMRSVVTAGGTAATSEVRAHGARCVGTGHAAEADAGPRTPFTIAAEVAATAAGVRAGAALRSPGSASGALGGREVTVTATATVMAVAGRKRRRDEAVGGGDGSGGGAADDVALTPAAYFALREAKLVAQRRGMADGDAGRGVGAGAGAGPASAPLPLFTGMSCYIDGRTDDELGANGLAHLIARHGGGVVSMMAVTRVTHILATHLNGSKTHAMLQRGGAAVIPVLHPRYITDCIKAGRRLPHVDYVTVGTPASGRLHAFGFGGGSGGGSGGAGSDGGAGSGSGITSLIGHPRAAATAAPVPGRR